jgi:hypothetical protein
VIRTNVLHRAVVLARAVNARPAVEARVWVGAELRAKGLVGFDIEDRIEIARFWLAALGERLEPGDAIITGSIVQAPVASGDEVTVELADLGRLNLTITD